MTPEAEAESTSAEPEGWTSTAEPETEPEAEGGSWSSEAEPVPEWNATTHPWQVMWQIHYYLIGIVMLILTLICIFNIGMYVYRKIHEEEGATKGYLGISLNCLIGWLGLSRGLILLIDPYYSVGRMPLLAYRLLWSTGWPALTGIFTFLLAVLLDSTKMSMGPPLFRKWETMLGKILGHFLIVTSVDVILHFYASAKILLLLCQTLFFLFALVMVIGYSYAAHKIGSNLGASAGAQGNGKHKFVLTLGLFAVDAFVMAAAHVYSAFGVFGVLSTLVSAPADPWLGLMYVLRVTEIVACCLGLATINRKKRVSSRPSVGEMSDSSTKSWVTQFIRNPKNKMKVTPGGGEKEVCQMPVVSD